MMGEETNLNSKLNHVEERKGTRRVAQAKLNSMMKGATTNLNSELNPAEQMKGARGGAKTELNRSAAIPKSLDSALLQLGLS